MTKLRHLRRLLSCGQIDLLDLDPSISLRSGGSFSSRTSSRGFVALASVLVIAAVVIAIGSSVALISISSLQTSFAGKQGQESLFLVEACVEDALIRLNETSAIPSSITLPSGSCSVTIDSQTGTTWTFTTSGTVDGYTSSVQVIAERTSNVSITSWREV